MDRIFRKQTHADFSARIARIDPYFARHGQSRGLDRTAPRTMPNALGGFGIAYVALLVAGNRPLLESSLAQGSLHVRHHDTVLMALTAFLAVAAVALVMHLGRAALARGSRRHNSRCLLIGALAALILTQTPPEFWANGYGMIGDTSRGLVAAAGDTVGGTLPRLNITGLTLVSGHGH